MNILNISNKGQPFILKIRKVCTKAHDMTCANHGIRLILGDENPQCSVDKLRSIHSDKKFISTLTFDLTHWKQP